MQQILNAIRMQASLSQNNKYFTKLGTISGYDPKTFTARVLLQPGSNEDEPMETGWLPIQSPWASIGGWGAFFAPEIGTMCAVHFQDGSLQAGSINLFIFQMNGTIPEVKAGELFLIHKTGTAIKMKEDGTLQFLVGTSEKNANLDIDVKGKINITATDDITIKTVGDDAKLKLDSKKIEMGDLDNPLYPTNIKALLREDSSITQNVKAS